MNDAVSKGLTNASPLADVPAGSLRVQLRVHQQAMLHYMDTLEKKLAGGWDICGQTLYSDWACLGDSVGVGKSLMVLGHIARNLGSGVVSSTKMHTSSTTHLFSLKQTRFTDASEGNALIIVPHTLFRQWADYIKKQTTLKPMLLDKIRCFQSATFEADMIAADIVLVSNTLYKHLSSRMAHEGIRWKRAFIDEADTIHLISGYPLPAARFTWFITASWMNILFPYDTIYMSRAVLAQHVYAEDAKYPSLRTHFQDFYNSTRTYSYERYHITSYNFLREILLSGHPLRGHLIARCTDAFIQESITLPPLHRRQILCKQSATHRIVQDVVPEEVRNMLHAGDTTGAMEQLGVKTEDTTSLLEAVTKTQKKELGRLEMTYEFKSKLEYATPAAKEAALKSLEEKITALQSQISSIESRIKNFKEEMCPICYDEPGLACVTPCCSRIFCSACIIESIARNPACPMCRAALTPSALRRVVADGEMNAIVEAGSGGADAEPEMEKKPQALLRLFKENPEGRFLVFSRYDNPFTTIEASLTELGVKVKQLKGNKDAIAATLRSFQGGDLRCLLLNAHYAGSGLNITAATHVVLLHAMSLEEEKQILGRAYRMGRATPLHFIKLVHEGENASAE